MSQVWKLIEAGVYTLTYHDVELRCKWTKSGWIVSKRDGDGWQGLTGDVKREDAQAKACALVDK